MNFLQKIKSWFNNISNKQKSKQREDQENITNEVILNSRIASNKKLYNKKKISHEEYTEELKNINESLFILKHNKEQHYVLNTDSSKFSKETERFLKLSNRIKEILKNNKQNSVIKLYNRIERLGNYKTEGIINKMKFHKELLAIEEKITKNHQEEINNTEENYSYKIGGINFRLEIMLKIIKDQKLLSLNTDYQILQRKINLGIIVFDEYINQINNIDSELINIVDEFQQTNTKNEHQ